MEFNEANAEDPRVADGSARVDVSRTGIGVRAPLDRTAQGVRARVTLATANRLRVQVTGAAGRFKYVRVFVLHGPERLVDRPLSQRAAEQRGGDPDGRSAAA